MSIFKHLTNPEVVTLAQLLLEARQARGVSLPNWDTLSHHNRTALLLDAAYVLREWGIVEDAA